MQCMFGRNKQYLFFYIFLHISSNCFSINLKMVIASTGCRRSISSTVPSSLLISRAVSKKTNKDARIWKTHTQTKMLLDQLENVHSCGPFNKINSDALLSKPSGAPNTVQIGVVVRQTRIRVNDWKIEIDDQCNVSNI